MMFGDPAVASSTTNAVGGGAQMVSAAAAPQRLEPNVLDIELTVPLMDGSTYLGDIVITVRADGAIAIPSARLLNLLSVALSPEALAQARSLPAGRASVGLSALMPAGIAIRYDSQKVELALDIPLRMKKVRTLQVSPFAVDRFGTYQQPAAFSAFLTVRGAINYVERGPEPGLGSPILLLDGATRFQGIVLESQAIYQPGTAGSTLQRQGSRIVYDDRKRLIRWTAGDLRSVVRSFQSAPDIAGISLLRSYSALQPQTITRPSGRQGFRLERPSTVEIWVNGQLVRRTRLNAGVYDLRDFPYTQGTDQARITIRDDAGRTETLNFTLFTDQYQLAAGLSEFGLYAGVKAPLGQAGPIYSREPVVSGFYRRGFTDNLTLGANFQADRRSRMAGVESILSTPFGAFGADLAVSDIDKRGMGFAALLTFHSLFQRSSGTSDAVDLSAEIWSRDFAPAGGIFSENPFAYRLGGSYSHAFSESLYAGADLHYAKGRGASPDVASYRASLGWRPHPRMNFNANASYQGAERTGRPGLIFQVSLMLQLGESSSVTAAYDSGLRTERLSYQMQHGQGAGSFDLSGALERSQRNVGISGSANYIASEGELGLDQMASFGGGAGSPAESRTSLRFATSIAFADGAVSIGRPISDSFAIVSRRANVKSAQVRIDPDLFGYAAGTTLLGTATAPNLISYNERTIAVDAPDIDAEVDLGPGAYRVLPPYRSGYRLWVGTDYPVTVVGRFIDEDGAPLSLVSGTATEVAAPAREPLQVFTNRDGRFGLTGVKPGRWRIEFHTDPVTIYLVDVPAGAMGLASFGDIIPSSTAARP